MPFISKSAYARHRGCSPAAVTYAIKQRRIAVRADGLIDPELADREWERNTRPRAPNLGTRPRSWVESITHTDVFPQEVERRLAQRIIDLAVHDFRSQEAGLRLAVLLLPPEVKEKLQWNTQVWAQLLPPGFIEAAQTPPGEVQEDLTPDVIEVLEGLITGQLVYTPARSQRRHRGAKP